MSFRKWAALLVLSGLSLSVSAQTDQPEPQTVWEYFGSAQDNVLLSQGVLCPGCQTTEDFANAARTACFSGYREFGGGIANIVTWGAPPSGTPGIVPGQTDEAGADDPCVYSMEIKGNFRTAAKVSLFVCNDDGRCLLVTHQFVPRCPGVGARITGGILTASVQGCSLFSTGIEGLCTTVRQENLSENTECIISVSDRGMLPLPLVPIPGVDDDTSPAPQNNHPHGLHTHPGHGLYYRAGFECTHVPQVMH